MRCKMWRTRSALAGAAAVVFSNGWALGTDITRSWIGPVGSWTEVPHWNGPTYPNNGGGTTYNAIIGGNGVSVSVTLDAPITINALHLNFLGTLAGDEQLTLLQASTWSGGTLVGNGTVNIQTALEFSGESHNLARFTLNVDSAGSILWSGGDIIAPDELGGGGIVNNAGLFQDEILFGGWYWNSAQTPVVNNTGTYRRNGYYAGVDHLNNSQFNNSGFVDVQTGDLWLSGGGTNTGSFSVAPGASLRFSDYHELFSGGGATTTVFSSTAVINSAGQVGFRNDFGNATTEFAGTYDSAYTLIDTDDSGQEGNGGQVTFAAGALVNTNTFGGQLEVRSGTVHFETGMGPIVFGDATLTNGVIDSRDELRFATLNWSGGKIVGDVLGSGSTSMSAANIRLTGADYKELSNVDLNQGVNGAMTISEGSLALRNSKLILLAGASLDFQGDARLVNALPGLATAEFDNAGTIIKSAGNGLAELSDVYMSNEGTVIVQSGTLRLAGGGFHQGTFEIASGATLDFGHGAIIAPHTLLGPTRITGAANSEMHISGLTYLDAAVVANLDRLSVGDFFQIEGETNTSSTQVDQGGRVYIFGGSLSVAGDLEIGPFGTGEMSVYAGGTVTSQRGFIGSFFSGDGSVTISGPGTSWTMTHGLYVGGRHGAAGNLGTLIIDDVASVRVGAGANTKVWGGGRIEYYDGSFFAGSLELIGGGDVILSAGLPKVLQTTSISTDAPNGSKLDLADNKAIIAYTGPTPIDSIRQQIRSAYADGAWTGDGITSSLADASRALGYGESTTLGITTFGGVSLSGNNVLIKYTYFGDANLSGFVDVGDLAALARHWNTTGDSWQDGDFNYDGAVNLADLRMLAANWGAGMGSPLPAPTLAPLLASLGLPNSEVPEPTGLGTMILAAWTLKRPRRIR